MIPLEERIDMDDLVTAIKSVYIIEGNPGVTFHTLDIAKAYQTGRWDVSYFGAPRPPHSARFFSKRAMF